MAQGQNIDRRVKIVVHTKRCINIPAEARWGWGGTACGGELSLACTASENLINYLRNLARLEPGPISLSRNPAT